MKTRGSAPCRRTSVAALVTLAALLISASATLGDGPLLAVAVNYNELVGF
jgi:hypothetical protein